MAQAERNSAEFDAKADRTRQAELRDNCAAVLAAVGARYRECSVDNFELSANLEVRKIQERVLGRLRAFCDDIAGHTRAGSGLLLYGPKGTGKDHLMVAALKHAASAGLTVCWVSGVELYARWRDAIGDDRNEHRDMAELVRPQILAISDPAPPVGALTDEKAAYRAEKLFWLIDNRYRAAKPTWVTLNVKDGKEAEKLLTGQIVDRLRDQALDLACSWPSHRKAIT